MQTQEIYKDAIGLLNKERLILWDRETKDCFPFFCKEAEVEELIEDISEG